MRKEVISNSSYSEKDSHGTIRESLLLMSRKNNTSHIAIVGANVYPIQSLDYEIVENDLFKQDWRSRKKVKIFQYQVLKWTLACLIGLSTGLVAFFNNLVVENIAGFKLIRTSNLILKNRYIMAFVTFAGWNVALATCTAVLCAYIAPAAAGSGILEVKAYLNGVDAHSILAPSTLFVKVEYKHMTPAAALEYVCSRRPSVFLAPSQWKAVQEYKQHRLASTAQSPSRDAIIITKEDLEGYQSFCDADSRKKLAVVTRATRTSPLIARLSCLEIFSSSMTGL